MAVYICTIDGTEQRVRRSSLRLMRRVNVRPTLEVEILSLDGSYIPAEGSAIELTEDAVPLFGGRVQHPSTGGVDGEPVEELSTRVDCVDHSALADDLYLRTNFPGGTVKDFLNFVCSSTYLGAKGVTVDPAQVDGPLVPAMPFTYRSQKRVSDGLTDVCKYAVAWSWSISASKVLSAKGPGTTPAPFNISDGDPRVIGDVRLDKTSEQYANRVLVLGNATEILYGKDDFTAETDGVRTVFTLKRMPSGEYPHLPNAGVVYIIADAGYEVGETFGFGSATWLYDADANSITDTGILYDPATGVGTPGGVTDYRAFPLPLHRGMWIIYSGTPEAFAMAEDTSAQVPPRGVVEKIVTSTSQDQTVLDAIAQSELVKALATPQTVVYDTDELGLAPGQVQVIDQPLRGISGTFLIQQVETRDIDNVDEDDTPLLRHTVTAVEFAGGATAYPGVVGDLYQLWSANPSTGAPAVTAGPGLAIPGNPREMFFNDGGVIGAARDSLYDKNGAGSIYGVDAVPARVAVLADDVGAAVSATFTKLYLAFSAAASYVPPTFKGGWNDTASVVTRKGLLAPVSSGGGTSSSVYVIENGSTPVDLLHLRIVSDALAAQTISGTIDLMLLSAMQPWPDMLACWHLHVYATVGDTDAVRCTLLNNYRENDPNVRYAPGTGQFSSFISGTLQGNKLFAPATLTPGAVNAGDHLVIEIGAIARNTYSGFSPGVRIQYGENVADTDALDADDGGPVGTGDHNNGYIVFSSPIGLAGPADKVQLAIANRAAGLSNALTLQQTDDGENYIKASRGIHLSTSHDLELVASRVTITAPSGMTVNGANVVTASSALTANGLVLGNGGVGVVPLGSLGTASTVLHGNPSGPPTFGPVALATEVSGRLPYANVTAATAASRLFGRGDSGAGDWQEISLGSGLSMTGTTLAATANVSAGASLTADVLVLGNGGTAVKTLGASGTASTVLHGNPSGPPTFGPVALGTEVSGRLPYANITAAIGASRLLGRGDSGAGDWQEISLGSGLSMTGTTLSASGGGGGGATHYDAPLTDGDLVEANLIFALGDCIIVQVPV